MLLTRKASGQLREKNMRASKPSHEIKNQVADKNLSLAIKMFSEGIAL
jgi:hypothetical protein